MTVRNIRAHQSRGLLPPPEVRARTGYYGPEHVARLRLIQELQGNGYNLAAIKDLVERRAAPPQDALDFARAILAPFEDERPEVIDAVELAERFAGGGDPKPLARAPRSSASSCRWGRAATRCRARRSCARGRRCSASASRSRRRSTSIEDVARQADSVGRRVREAVPRPGLEAVRPRRASPSRTGRPCSPRSSSCARSPPRWWWRSSSRA